MCLSHRLNLLLSPVMCITLPCTGSQPLALSETPQHEIANSIVGIAPHFDEAQGYLQLTHEIPDLQNIPATEVTPQISEIHGEHAGYPYSTDHKGGYGLALVLILLLLPGYRKFTQWSLRLQHLS